MKQNTKIFASLFFTLALVFSINLASATLSVDQVTQGVLYPGSEASISLDIRNSFDYDVEDVYLTLDFSKLVAGNQPLFTAVGSSQDSQDSINEDDDESFSFKIKAANTILPGSYNLPYTISYRKNSTSNVTETSGIIGITVNSKTSLDFSAAVDNPVIGEKGKVKLKIINKGLGDIKFVSVDIQPDGYTLLSSNKYYIGSLSSDDFDTASFDVVFKKTNPNLVATITYSDFENNQKTENINLQLTIYTKEKALGLGIIKPNNTPKLIGTIIVLVIIFMIYRKIKKMHAEKKKKAAAKLDMEKSKEIFDFKGIK